MRNHIFAILTQIFVLPVLAQGTSNPGSGFVRATPAKRRQKSPIPSPVNVRAGEVDSVSPLPSSNSSSEPGASVSPPTTSVPNLGLGSYDKFSPAEALACTFSLLKLAPPFEEATIALPESIMVLIADPNGYVGPMRPVHGTVTWVNGDGKSFSEKVNSNLGFSIVKWPQRQLGFPEGATAVLVFNSPVICARWMWPDYALYGADIHSFLISQVGNWSFSSRRLPLNRERLREGLFPKDLKTALQHPDVAPVLEPHLKRVAPQLLLDLKGQPSGR